MSPVIFCSGDRHTKTRTNAANRGMVGLKQCNPCLPSLAQVLALTTMIVGTTVVERVRRTPTMRSPAAGAAEEQAKSLYVRARELPLALQRRGGQGRRLRGVCDGYGQARHGGRRADAEDTDHALAREMVTSRATGKVPRLRLTATQGRVGRRGSGIATGLSAPRHRWCRVGGGHPPTRAASEGARRHRVEGHDVITSRRCSAGAGKVGVREGCANATGTTRRQSFGCRIHPPRARPKSTSTQSWHTRRPDISSRHSVAGGVGVGGSERSVAR